MLWSVNIQIEVLQFWDDPVREKHPVRTQCKAFRWSFCREWGSTLDATRNWQSSRWPPPQNLTKRVTPFTWRNRLAPTWQTVWPSHDILTVWLTENWSTVSFSTDPLACCPEQGVGAVMIGSRNDVPALVDQSFQLLQITISSSTSNFSTLERLNTSSNTFNTF